MNLSLGAMRYSAKLQNMYKNIQLYEKHVYKGIFSKIYGTDKSR